MSEANQETENQNLESGAETNLDTENSGINDSSDANEAETDNADGSEQTNQPEDKPEDDDDSENKTDGADTEDSNEAQEKHQPNVKFVGRREVLNKQTNKPHLVSIEAPRHVNDADDYIELPESREQKKGFYHPKANVLFRLFPDDYKPFVIKGE